MPHAIFSTRGRGVHGRRPFQPRHAPATAASASLAALTRDSGRAWGKAAVRVRGVILPVTIRRASRRNRSAHLLLRGLVVLLTKMQFLT